MLDYLKGLSKACVLDLAFGKNKWSQFSLYNVPLNKALNRKGRNPSKKPLTKKDGVSQGAQRPGYGNGCSGISTRLRAWGSDFVQGILILFKTRLKEFLSFSRFVLRGCLSFFYDMVKGISIRFKACLRGFLSVLRFVSRDSYLFLSCFLTGFCSPKWRILS